MTQNEVPEHLHATRTDRGFEHMPPIPNRDGGEVRVYESSAADGPHLWLRVRGRTGEGLAHLTAEDAWKVADQLRWLVEHHYQGDARPEVQHG